MKRYQRLRDGALFRQVRKEGRSWAHPLLVLCVLSNDLPYSRFGFTASRRVGKAVARNRARRLMREAARLHLQDIEVGWDLVFVARAPIAQASYQEVATACATLLRRARLWRQEQ